MDLPLPLSSGPRAKDYGDANGLGSHKIIIVKITTDSRLIDVFVMHDSLRSKITHAGRYA